MALAPISLRHHKFAMFGSPFNILKTFTPLRMLQRIVAIVLIATMALNCATGTCHGESVAGGKPLHISALDVFEDLAAPRSSLDRLLLEDAADGHWDRLSLCQAALIADGVQDEESLARFTQELERVRDVLTREPFGEEPPRAVFEFMHKQVLRGVYRAQCTLSRSLDQGDFNCLTATVLYQWLCEACGIECHPISATAHVYCRIAGAESCDVETTSRAWTQAVQSRRDVEDAAHARVITPVELVGKIYYNRGSAMLEQGLFAEAIETLRMALELDSGHQAARTNFLAAINNWALAKCDAGAYDDAAQLVIQGLQLAPEYEPLRTNDVYVHHRWILFLCRESRYEEALEILRQSQQRRPDATLFRAGQLTVYRAWAMSLLERDQWHEARSLFLDAQRDYGDRPGLQACAHQAVRDFASQVEATGDHSRAQAALELLKTLSDQAG